MKLKPSLKQLAARRKFVAMVRKKAKAKKRDQLGSVGAVAKKTTKKKTKTPAKSIHKDTNSHNVKIHVVSGIGAAKTQVGAIRMVYMKRKLRNAGFSVPAEIATNDLVKLYKTIFGKQPISVLKIKSLLKKGTPVENIYKT